MKQVVFLLCTLATSVLGAALSKPGSYAPYFGHGHLEITDYGAKLDLNTALKPELPAGFLFGHGFIDGLDSSAAKGGFVGFEPQQLEYHASGLGNSFEVNLVSPEIPKPILGSPLEGGEEASKQSYTPQVPNYPPLSDEPKYQPRYTKTSTQTYEVKEENYEPVPIPKINVANPFVPSTETAISIGSGSLGVADTGDGKLQIGSGSVGYSSSGFQPTSSLTADYTVFPTELLNTHHLR